MNGYIILFLLAIIVGMIIGMVIEKQRNAKVSWNKFDEYAYALEDLTPDVPAVKAVTVNMWKRHFNGTGYSFADFEKDFFDAMQYQGIRFRRAVKK